MLPLSLRYVDAEVEAAYRLHHFRASFSAGVLCGWLVLFWLSSSLVHKGPAALLIALLLIRVPPRTHLALHGTAGP